LRSPSLPDLYHGTPVRVYGRYRNGGTATVALAGEVRGIKLDKTARLDFPDEDPGDPEIERMWAWHRVDHLLKSADRNGSRQAAIDEVVRLGEVFSIATEYTSFIVLENDAEYRRWKIDRKNALLVERDRKAQERLRASLDSIRDRALGSLGPQAAEEMQAVAARAAPKPQTARNQPQPQTRVASNQPRKRKQSWDFSIGSGPVGPLFVGLAAWLKRRKRTNH
jgi:hypothetical protein